MSQTNDNKTEPHSGPIAEALIGVWRLREYSEVTEGQTALYPFGPDPDGLLIYTPDGFVSALLMARGRPNLSGNGFRRARRINIRRLERASSDIRAATMWMKQTWS